MRSIADISTRRLPDKDIPRCESRPRVLVNLLPTPPSPLCKASRDILFLPSLIRCNLFLIKSPWGIYPLRVRVPTFQAPKEERDLFFFPSLGLESFLCTGTATSRRRVSGRGLLEILLRSSSWQQIRCHIPLYSSSPRIPLGFPPGSCSLPWDLYPSADPLSQD